MDHGSQLASKPTVHYYKYGTGRSKLSTSQLFAFCMGTVLL